MWLTKSSLFPVTVKPRFPKKSRKAVTFHFFFFCNSSQYALHPWFNFLLLFGLTIASKCERSLPLRHDWTSAPGKLPFWPERDVIGHDLVSYPTWRRLSANSGIDSEYLGPLFLTWFNSIPAWISNYIHYKVWDEITYPFLKFRNGFVISPHTLLGTWLLIHAGIKVKPC